MIGQISICETFEVDPYRNLALEKYLLDNVQPGQCILYLWQNQNTVVIGRNQNPWAECRTALLEAEGGHLARRLSGGGAVFHDVGNLNFTFLTHREDQDVARQLKVIQTACQFAGICVQPSGRNDLLAEGKKFSGNAFYHSRGRAYHHGTILVNADMQKLSRYLSPPKAKLEAKGISSVRSRVVNLSVLSPGLSCETVRQYMRSAFARVYELPPTDFILPPESSAAIQALAGEYGSWEYLYGTPLPFTFQCQQKFPWGHIQIQLNAKNGVISGTKAYSDAMDWTLSQQLELALTGCRFDPADMESSLHRTLDNKQVAEDLSALLNQTI